MQYEIIFYEDRRGNSPLDIFLDSLSTKERAKVMAIMKLLEEQGHRLKRPYAAPLSEGIMELRIQYSPNKFRLLYFFFLRKTIVFTNAFKKKTDKAPKGEIQRAIRRKADFIKGR